MSACLLDPAARLRPMVGEDLPAVMRVERAAYPFPWTEGIFRDCLKVGYCCWVAERREELIGHGVMSAAVGECHILNVCVHPDWQGHQLGRMLLRKLLVLGRRHQADTAFLEVRPSNDAAIRLYVAEGFCEVGRRRAYYPAAKGKEDAIIMAKPLLSD
ncbi:ribosomal-protein-alanine acetyltransferase [Thioflavicoccus mobilis 8321]|uniref:[Ribosomal protein bS18]-alanine N-acetyltransferase n=1 Tax=Thioflavicoccus mobilis 8321 TaxID=765912 RepID=L0GXU5_9GAMM|nr:ribosomal protein S18-alanine N-acetyltransferase [Thioflavicoccus mobilis]AGA90200.1 ribosomal-protein-alanine acetyltransferase [Thioflavicoccus mobilis 8321]